MTTEEPIADEIDSEALFMKNFNEMMDGRQEMANDPDFLNAVDNRTLKEVIEKTPVDQDLKDLTLLSVLFGQEMAKRQVRKVGVRNQKVRSAIEKVHSSTVYRATVDKFPPDVGGTARGEDTASFQMRRYYRPYGWNQDEELANSGPAAFYRMMTTRRNKAIEGIRFDINKDLFLDGSRTPYSLDGLQAAIDATNTYGDIDRSTNPFWQAQEMLVNGPFQAEGPNSLQKLIDDCSVGQGAGRPDSVWGDKEVWHSYNNRLAATVRTSQKEIGDWPLNAKNVTFEGIPFCWTPANPPGEIYVLNSDYIYMIVHSGNNMRWTPMKPAASNRPWSYIGYLSITCQLVITSPVRFGKMLGVTA